MLQQLVHIITARLQNVSLTVVVVRCGKFHLVNPYDFVFFCHKMLFN